MIVHDVSDYVLLWHVEQLQQHHLKVGYVEVLAITITLFAGKQKIPEGCVITMNLSSVIFNATN